MNSLERLLMQLSSILGEKTIAFRREFLVFGGVKAALLLSQAVYWSKIAGGGWFYKTQAEWERETGLSRKEQETARRALRKHGVLEEQRAGIPAKLHFRVNIEAVVRILLKENDVQTCMHGTDITDCTKCADKNAQNGQSNTENTTENTTEINPPCIPPLGRGDSTHTVPVPSQQKPKKETPRQVLEHVLRPEDAAAVIEHRQRLRKPLTHRAAKLLANAFSEIEPEKRSEAVDMMIVSGWTGFKAEWFNNRQQQSSCPSSRADMQPSEMLAEHVMRIEAEDIGRHSREAFVRWAVACRGYALSHDWKAVLVEVDTIVKALKGRLAEGRDDLLALAIEDLTAGEEGKKLNSDMIVRRYNELHALWKGRSEMIYDDDGMPAGFRTVLTDEGKALHKRLQERFGSSQLEGCRDRG